jgi:p-hydroxybenzoic acid efflux pump subunit AaeB
MERSLSRDTAGSKSQRAYAVKHSNLLSAICNLLLPSILLARMNWTRQDLFGDFRVQHGIKLGIAGLLAVFCAQVLRLPSDNWAILTIVVLMNGKFVGAFALKAVMRLTGTVAGAVVGVWLASDYTNSPVILLSLFFLVMTFAGYKFGQIGAREGPYAHFLLGLTTLTVVTDSVMVPGQAWYTGLIRTEEILVGVICSLLVSTLIWPRYAREEFFAAGRDVLKTASELFSLHKLTYVSAGEISLEIHKLHQTFDNQFAHLTSLKQAGERESAVFSARIGNYNAFMVALNNLFRASLALNRYRGEAWLLKHVRWELEALFDAISEEFQILLGSESPGQRLLTSHIEEAFVAFEAKVNELRAEGMLVEAPLRAAMDFAGEFAVLRRLTNELNNIRSTLEALPRYGQALPAEKPRWEIIPPIDWYWLKVGIKGGLAAVIAVLLLRWTHPPGATNVPTWAWLLVVMRRSFFRSAGASDLRTSEIALQGSLILAGCTLVLIVITPALASYTAMNLVLFLLLFVTGFFTATLPGVTFWTEFTFLATSTFVALNPQVPVPPITIIDSFVGTMVGLWIATVVSRLLWPLLPQKVLRDSLSALFAQTKDLLGGALNREKVLTQLTNLPVEAMGAVSQIQIAGCSEEERTNLSFLIDRAQALVIRVSQLVCRRPVLRSGSTELAEVLGEGGNLLPEITGEILNPHFTRLEFEFQQMLDAFTDCFRDGNCSREFPTIRGALTGMDQAVQQIRDRNLLEDLSPEASLQFLDVVDRYHATADSLEECGRLIRSLRIERYCGDYGL